MARPQVLHDGTGIIMEVPGVGILQAHGPTVPADGTAGYAPGCLFQHNDGSTGTMFYVNEGSVTSAAFKRVATSTVVDTDDMQEGSGITGATGGHIEHNVVRIGALIKTEIIIDMTGLDGPGTADDIIGQSAAANCHLGQITAAKNGTIFAGEMRCLEAPAGTNIDVNLNAASVGTGVENADVKALDGYAQLLNAGNWTVNTFKGLTAFPAANSYLYLSSGVATEAAVTAGIFVITLWGK